MTILESREAPRLARGVCRALFGLGYAPLTEFTLRNGRRADVIGMSGSGAIAIVEIKTSEADFRADGKWPEYLPFCDSFYFAVPEGFRHHILPESCGLMIADAYQSAILRPSPPLPAMGGARRRALILSFAMAASARLQRLLDPEAGL